MKLTPSSNKPLKSNPSSKGNPKVTCPSGKIVYFSEAKAKVAKEIILEKKDMNLRPYKCDLGNHWHLTHVNKQEKRKDHRAMRRRDAKTKRLAKKEK